MNRRPGGQQIIPRPGAVTIDDAAPWAPDARFTVDQLVRDLGPTDQPMLPAFPNARPSAVLVVLYDDPAGSHGPEVLLTRRSQQLRHHPGEISFPGGRIDPGETPVDTALREAHEEVGLDPAAVTIRGELDHLSTVVSRSYIVPIVATIEHRPDLRCQTMEVDRVMWVPIRELTRADTFHRERWDEPPFDRTLSFFELDDETVWGATAHMLVDLLTRAG